MIPDEEENTNPSQHANIRGNDYYQWKTTTLFITKSKQNEHRNLRKMKKMRLHGMHRSYQTIIET